MANEWTLKSNEIKGGQSGQFLNGSQIRKNEDGSVDFLAVMATTAEGPPYNFPDFAYQGLIWNIAVKGFDFGEKHDKAEGTWNNNARKLPGEEDGTYTAQAGSGGGGMEEDGREDAASAYAG
jgi:hypothetical protein